MIVQTLRLGRHHEKTPATGQEIGLHTTESDTSMPDTPESNAQIIEFLAAKAKQANVFGAIEITENRLQLQAWGAADPAFYRVYLDPDPIVELATKDRWLSGSIESQLVATGDKLGELIEDELFEVGYEGENLGDSGVAFEHYRSEDMEFVFRSKVIPMEGQNLPEACLQWLLAYEQCFRQLGDMDESNEE